MQEELTTDQHIALEQLRSAVVNRTVTQQQIAFATGVDQSQVSRILAGQMKRASANVVRLCRFAYQMGNSHEPDPSRNQTLVNALRTVWDGTEAHAQAISQVILSLRHFREAP